MSHRKVPIFKERNEECSGGDDGEVPLRGKIEKTHVDHPQK